MPDFLPFNALAAPHRPRPWLVVALASVWGCGSSAPSLSAGLGPRAATTLWIDTDWRPQDVRSYVGPSGELRVYPWRDQAYALDGLAFGIEESYLPLWTQCCYGRREQLLVSWGHVPRSPNVDIGYELTLPMGYARLDWGRTEPAALLAGLRAALLLKPRWPGFLYDECSQPLLAYRPLFVFELGAHEVLPYEGTDRRVRTELTGLGALRFDVSLLP